MLLVRRRCSPETGRGVHSVLETFLDACCLIANGLREGHGGRGKAAGDAGCQSELHPALNHFFWTTMLFDVDSVASTAPEGEGYANIHPDCKEGTTFCRPFTG